MLGYILLRFYIIREIYDFVSYTLELTYLLTIYNEFGFYLSPQLSKGQPERNCALERTLHALSARSRITPVRGTCSIHSLSASYHDVDGALETGNEHLPHVPRRGAITLQDVAHLTGLSVSGDALYVEYEKETNWAAIVEEVLGRSPGGHMKDGRRVQMKWLQDNFYTCADIEYGSQLRQYACAYMLSSIGAFLMPDRSNAYVHCQYLLAFREQRQFAWGASVLSWMYRELGRVTFKIEGGPTSTSADNIGGWMALLQAWCLERFPSIARRMHERGLRRPQSRILPLIARLVSIIFK
ncbi:Protein MAIN-LIKE 2 [Linum grandiflorum]